MTKEQLRKIPYQRTPRGKKLAKQREVIYKRLCQLVSNAYGMRVQVQGRYDIRYAANRLPKNKRKAFIKRCYSMYAKKEMLNKQAKKEWLKVKL